MSFSRPTAIIEAEEEQLCPIFLSCFSWIQAALGRWQVAGTALATAARMASVLMFMFWSYICKWLWLFGWDGGGRCRSSFIYFEPNVLFCMVLCLGFDLILWDDYPRLIESNFDWYPQDTISKIVFLLQSFILHYTIGLVNRVKRQKCEVSRIKFAVATGTVLFHLAMLWEWQSKWVYVIMDILQWSSFRTRDYWWEYCDCAT